MLNKKFFLTILCTLMLIRYGMADNQNHSSIAAFEETKSISLKIETGLSKDVDAMVSDFWLVEAYPIDDYGRINGQKIYGYRDTSGATHINLTKEYQGKPIVIKANNEILYDYFEGGASSVQVFLPANCSLSEITIDSVSEAVWKYYEGASSLMGNSFSPSLVDCELWVKNLEAIKESQIMREAVQNSVGTNSLHVDAYAIEDLFRNEPALLQSTLTPSVIAAKMYQRSEFYQGAELFNYDFILDDHQVNKQKDIDPIIIDRQGMVREICGHKFSGKLVLNERPVYMDRHHELDNENFFGTIHSANEESPNWQTRVINVRHGTANKRKYANAYDDACSLTTIVEFHNKQNQDQNLEKDSGFFLHNFLTPEGSELSVVQTSTGDDLVDAQDTWAIFGVIKNDQMEYAIIVELLGNREGDYQDGVHMKLTGDYKKDLFIGLKKNVSHNPCKYDAEKTYLKFDMTIVDFTDEESVVRSKKDIATCLFSLSEPFAKMVNKKVFSENTDLKEAALMIARSQCFSASPKQQSFNTKEAALWSLSSNHGTFPNVMINTGWLPPNEKVEIFTMGFGKRTFEGPKAVEYTDSFGQLLLSLPNLIEGDRVLFRTTTKPEFDLNIPVMREYTGAVYPSLWPVDPT